MQVTVHVGVNALVPLKYDEEDEALIRSHNLYLAHHGYWVCSRCNKYLHRLLISCEKGLYVDHINGDKEDCRKNNLRVVTPSLSGFNRATTPGKYLRGVARKRSGKYWAKVTVNGNQIYLGQTDLELDAHILYLEGCMTFYGEYPPCDCYYCQSGDCVQ